MYYIYALECLIKDKKIIYIGCTEDLRVRLKKHENKSVNTTKKFDQIRLIYYEACLNKKDAQEREKSLKTGFG